MINELYSLSKAMEQAGIRAQNWHRKYTPIPNISVKAPCYRIILDAGQISEITTINKELGTCLRRYGSNQSTFNACNLAPLYRVTDEDIKKKLRNLQAGKLEGFDLAEIRSWCAVSNWGKNFRSKYTRSMKVIPNELHDILGRGADSVKTLLDETAPFSDAQTFYDALEKYLFSLLEKKTNVVMALQMLIYAGNAAKPAKEDIGKLSVVFDCRKLIDSGLPAASKRFTNELNLALLAADTSGQGNIDDTVPDAFGNPFTPLDDSMPMVKLAGGFDVSLRTMFGEVHCQRRYGRTESASYPLSSTLRLELRSALEWLGNAEHKYQTWMNTDKDEILFVYPHTLPKTSVQFIRAFKRMPNSTSLFEKEASSLIADLRGIHPEGAQAHADRLSIIFLHKIDRGRSKVSYDRVTDPAELKERADAWSQGCQNLPSFPFGQPLTPFPGDIADTLNQVWKQDGTLATVKLKPVPHYRGLELLLEKDTPVTQNLALLVRSCISLAAHLGVLSTDDRSYKHQIWLKVREMLALCGLLLDKLNVRRNVYMEDFPYQYGQLLKISDEIHVLYCKAERKGEVSPQLAGSGLVQAATEAPIRTLRQLGQRMQPYVTWAKSYRYKGIIDTDKESWRAGWLMNLYEETASKLYNVWSSASRFDDSQKAQLFLGFIAALPKQHKHATQTQKMSEIDTNEMEENSHE